MMEFSLWLNVLEEHYFEEMSFEENVNQSRSHLDYSYIKEESRTENGQMNIVVNTGETVILFIC